MWSSEHSLLLQLVLVPPAGVVVVAVGDAAVGAQREVESPLHRQVVPADEAVVVAVAQFPHFEDRQLSRGFRSSRGQQPSTTTIRRMP
jgi:hypothetical protein